MCKNKKGELNGVCNTTSCKSNLLPNWYNHDTKKYYCTECVELISSKKVNKRYVFDSFGNKIFTMVNIKKGMDNFKGECSSSFCESGKESRYYHIGNENFYCEECVGIIGKKKFISEKDC